MHAGLKGEKILIVKTAWGGKTLAGDFRPPSSCGPDYVDRFCTGDCPRTVGHYYSVGMGNGGTYGDGFCIHEQPTLFSVEW